MRVRLPSDFVINNISEISLSHLERSVVDLLAWQKLQQILEQKDDDVVEETPQLPARALLCPLQNDLYLKVCELIFPEVFTFY